MTIPITAQAEEIKYKLKYALLSTKLSTLEQSNNQLTLTLLRSKRRLHRLTLQRSLLYDRLTKGTTPSNPYSLHSTHLPTAESSTLPLPLPASILDQPSYAVPDPTATALAQQRIQSIITGTSTAVGEAGPVAGSSTSVIPMQLDSTAA